MAAYRYAAVLIGAGLAGLGGAFLTRGHSNQFVEGIASGRGCIAPGAALHRRIEEASDRYGLGVRPGAATETLSVGEQQRVEDPEGALPGHRPPDPRRDDGRQAPRAGGLRMRPSAN